jgi:ubiquinone/menaquinone biosynthesis C-methylase UbiE
MSHTALYDVIAPLYDATRVLPEWVADRVAETVVGGIATPGEHRSVLEIGVGTGRIAQGFTRRGGYRHYLGLDVSARMLAALVEKCGDKVHAVLGDASRLPFASGSVDAVLSCHVLQMVPDLDRAVDEIGRVLRTGGLYAHCTEELAPHHQAYDQIWQGILAETEPAYRPGRRYDMRREEIVTIWTGRGARVEVVEAARWPVSHRLGDLLGAYEQKAYPSCHAVRQEVFDTAIERLREVSVGRYGTLDHVFSSVNQMEVVCVWPAGRGRGAP